MARLSSWLAAVFLIACLVLGYFYLKQRAEMALVRAEASEATAREQQGRRQVTEFRQKLAAADDAARKAEEELSAQDRAATARTPATAAAGANRVIDTSDIARDHPEYAELQRKQMRRSILRQYGDALAGFNLAPEQLAQLKDLLVARSFPSDDPRLAGLERGTPAYMEAMRAAGEAVGQQIDALIGRDGQRKLQDAQMLTSAQNQVANTYAPDFQEAGVPLTPEQASSLAQLLNPRNNLGGGRAMNQFDPATWLSPRDAALFDQAAQVLSPAQLAILKGDRADQNHMQSIMRSYLSARRPGGLGHDKDHHHVALRRPRNNSPGGITVEGSGGLEPERHPIPSTMPQGSKASYSAKQKREAGHIEKSYEKRGVGKKTAAKRAWATVNKQDGGAKGKGAKKKK